MWLARWCPAHAPTTGAAGAGDRAGAVVVAACVINAAGSRGGHFRLSPRKTKELKRAQSAVLVAHGVVISLWVQNNGIQEA